MISERELLFVLTRQRFTPDHRQRTEEICARAPVDWASVAAMATSEGVAPIVAVNLAACDSGRTDVPAPITARLQGALLENVAFKMQRRQQLADAIVRLAAAGYDALLLKSAALEAAGVYEHSWVTCARDLDIVLKAREAGNLAPDEHAVRSALWAAGVECDVDDHEDFCFAGQRLSFQEAWRGARAIRLAGVAAPAFLMGPEELLLTLCVNSCHKWYFRLKMLFDVAETVAYYRDLDWVRFVHRARAADSEGVVFTALCAAGETLGLPAGADTCYSELVSRGRARLLRSTVKLLARSSSGGLLPVGMLKYASYNRGHRLTAAKYFALHGLNRIAPPSVGNALPGETIGEASKLR